MKRRRSWPMACFASACLAVLPVPGIGLAEAEGEAVHGPLPWHVGENDVFVKRVVSAATTEPIAHAVVKLYAEVPHPIPGARPATGTGMADAAGWVRIRRADLDDELVQRCGDPTWAYVEAPGYGPNAVYGGDRTASDADVELRPASELRVTLRDPLHRPIEGVELGWLLGCGHAPDVLQATTDASGTARLVGVQDEGYGQIWPVKEGFASWYVTDAAWRPWELPRVMELAWGTTVVGRVVHPDGRPASGVGVGANECHRGPWAVTDGEGCFRLIGLAYGPGARFRVEPSEYVVGPAGAPDDVVYGHVPLPGLEATILLPEPGEERTELPDHELLVDVDVSGWSDAEREDLGLSVVASRVRDGWTWHDAFSAEEIPALRLPADTYEVEVCAGGTRGPLLARTRQRVRVDGAETRLGIALVRPRSFVLVHPGGEATMRVVIDREVVFETDEAGEHVVGVPGEGRAFVRVDQPGRVHVQPIDLAVTRPEAELPRVRPPLAHAVEIAARLHDEAGDPIEGWLGEHEQRVLSGSEVCYGDQPAAHLARAYVLSGRDLTLVAWPKNETRYQPVLIRIPVAGEGGATSLDLGSLTLLARRPHLDVIPVHGQDARDLRVTLTNGPRQETLLPDEHGRLLDPWHAPGLLRAGTIVRVHTSGMPVVATLEGEGPWSVRVPSGRLDLRLVGTAESAGIDFAVRVDGRAFRARAGRLTVDGLPDGLHEAVIELPERPVQRMTFAIEGGETCTVSLRSDG
ncbi:MAG: hypothetical protein AB7T63_16410 [Planctomycetota bacterium]